MNNRMENKDDSVRKEELLKEDDTIILTTKRVLKEGVDKRASDILIEPLTDCLQVRYKIDGIFYKFHSFPFELHQRMVSCIKIISDLNIAEHRLPQEGRFRLKKITGQDVDIRVSIVPSILGEKVALRILDREKVDLNLDKLGIDPFSLACLKRNLRRPHGIILVCGPTGSGKTTTLYSALKFIDSIEKNIVTIEDPIEYELYGINQVEVNERVGLTFATVLRSVLRQDPDIILVGEMRDYETVEIALRAALTGHLVLSTLHTSTTSSAIMRLQDMGAESFLIASSLILVCAQLLIRVLCSNCKEEFSPSLQIKELFTSHGLEVGENNLYKGRGCKECFKTGFRGRKAIMEALELNPVIRERISGGISERELRELALKEGMRSLERNALEEVLQGTTSLEEIFRII